MPQRKNDPQNLDFSEISFEKSFLFHFVSRRGADSRLASCRTKYQYPAIDTPLPLYTRTSRLRRSRLHRGLRCTQVCTQRDGSCWVDVSSLVALVRRPFGKKRVAGVFLGSRSGVIVFKRHFSVVRLPNLGGLVLDCFQADFASEY